MSGNKVAPTKDDEAAKIDVPLEESKPTRKWYDPGFPFSVYLIVTSEFCERFTFYGMRAILTIYFLNGLLYDSATSVSIYHAFVMCVYFTPIIGGVIADSWWGKYKTIVILSIVYAIGNCSVAFTSFDDMEVVVKQIGCFVGLALIAVGTGGIKPCVSGFGADQIPEDSPEVRSRYFSAFYFAVNSGSFVSTLLTPVLRTVDCGQGACFPLAFGVPAGLMIIAIILFLLGTPWYKMVKPKGNILLDVTKCIWHAIGNWRKFRKTDPRPGLLDYATVDGKYEVSFVEDIRACKQILIILLPAMVFWALFDQHGSTWTLQAQRMDGTLGSIYVLPDQMQIINPALILIMIPLFEAIVYPLFNKCNIFMPTRLLQRMVVGLSLAALSFVCAAVVEYLIQPNTYVDPPRGEGWVHIVNLDPKCNISVVRTGALLPYLQDEKDKNLFSLPTTSSVAFKINLMGSQCGFDGQTIMTPYTAVEERYIHAFYHSQSQFLPVRMPDFYKDSTGPARIKAIVASATLQSTIKQIEVVSPSGSKWDFYPASQFQVKPSSGFTEIPANKYTFKITATSWTSSAMEIKETNEIELGVGFVGTLVFDLVDGNYRVTKITELPPKLISSFWMLPQYTIITMAEILFSISGLNFAYSQAPQEMRSVMLAYWYLMVAFGNLIVLVITEILTLAPAGMSLFYAGLTVIATAVLAIMSIFYKYVEVKSKEKEAEGDDASSSASSEDLPPPAFNEGLDDDRTGLPLQDPAHPEVAKYEEMAKRHEEHVAHNPETVVATEFDVDQPEPTASADPVDGTAQSTV